MARYHEIADDLRARIARGEWAVGQKLPGITALQDHYEVEKSLGTIRRAQQLLVADGMLRTEQGVGAFVTATKPVRTTADVRASLTAARDLLDGALAALPDAKNKVTFDLDEDAVYFVLDNALRDFGARTRNEDNLDDEDIERWSSTAERLRDQIDAALG